MFNPADGDASMMESGLMSMLGGFTVLRLTSLMGSANVSITKEDLLAINAMLNQIPKA